MTWKFAVVSLVSIVLVDCSATNADSSLPRGGRSQVASSPANLAKSDPIESSNDETNVVVAGSDLLELVIIAEIESGKRAIVASDAFGVLEGSFLRDEVTVDRLDPFASIEKRLNESSLEIRRGHGLIVICLAGDEHDWIDSLRPTGEPLVELPIRFPVMGWESSTVHGSGK
ncbi:MAG: hypothetical protein R3F20_13955 [Planctomycetota bacterium]